MSNTLLLCWLLDGSSGSLAKNHALNDLLLLQRTHDLDGRGIFIATLKCYWVLRQGQQEQL